MLFIYPNLLGQSIYSNDETAYIWLNKKRVLIVLINKVVWCFPHDCSQGTPISFLMSHLFFILAWIIYQFHLPIKVIQVVFPNLSETTWQLHKSSYYVWALQYFQTSYSMSMSFTPLPNYGALDVLTQQYSPAGIFLLLSVFINSHHSFFFMIAIILPAHNITSKMVL